MIEIPQSFVTRQECEKVAFQNGYRRTYDEVDGWVKFSSTTAQGSIWLARTMEGLWLLATDHAGVIAELNEKVAKHSGPGLGCFQFHELGELYSFLPRVYELALSLPDAPLHEFIAQTRNLPNKTDVERLVIQRIGQDIFRKRLMNYWQGKCPLTGISDKALLRASHLKPWKSCDEDAERLDVHNGILLSALWDAAFDNGLVTFEDNGEPVLSPQLSKVGRNALRYSKPLPLTKAHQHYLNWHRTKVFLD